MNTIRTIPLPKLQEYIVRPQEEVIPLGLFKGNVNLERVKACWNFFCGLQESEVPNLSDATKLSKTSLDLDHICGIHHPLSYIGLQSFASRIWRAKRPQDKRLREYVYWLTKGNLFDLPMISDYNARSWREWRGGKVNIVYMKQPFLHKNEPLPPSFYPFITTEPQKEHDLLLAVHDAVPTSIPEIHREDICQDLIVAILEGKAKRENLPDEVPKFIKEGFYQFPTKYAPMSLDADLPQKDGETGFTLLDVLSDDNIEQRW